MKALQNIGNKMVNWLHQSEPKAKSAYVAPPANPADQVTINGPIQAEYAPRTLKAEEVLEKSQPVEIHPVRPAELTVAQQIAEQTFKQWDLPEEYFFSCGPVYGSAFTGDRIDVAAAGNKVVGYVQFGANEEIQKAANIDVLMVVPQAQGRGVGEGLLLGALEKINASGYQQVTLQVEDGNTGAESLYKKYGFVPTKVLSDYYPHNSGPNTGAVEMTLTLNEQSRALLAQKRQQLDLLNSSGYPSQRFQVSSSER